MNAFLLVEVVDHGGIASGQSLELFLAARVRQASAIENETASVSAFIFRQAAVKGETENSDNQIIRVRCQSLQFLRRQHAVKCFEDRGQRDWQCDVVLQPAQILQRIGHALQKMHFTLVEATKSVRSQRLHDADVDIGVVVLHEGIALHVHKAGQSVQIMVEQLLAQFRRKIRLGVIQQRSDIVLQRALAPTLIVHEVGLAFAQHDIARLKVPVQKKVPRRTQQKLREAAEVVLQRLLVERNTRKAQEIVFKIVQVPRDRLPVKASTRIADFVVQIASGFDLKTWEGLDDAAIRFNHGGRDRLARSIGRQKFKK